MKNKRGMLLASEMVKLIIAVIAIAFLAYFLTMLYFSKVSEEKSREAKIVMVESERSVMNIIKGIVENENITQDQREIGIPEGWYLFSFVGSQKKPNSCAGLHCLCICDNVVDFFDRQIKECDKSGACIIVKNLDPKSDLEAEIIGEEDDLTQILIKEENNIIKVEEIS